MRKKPKKSKAVARKQSVPQVKLRQPKIYYYTITDLINDAKLFAKKYPNAGVFGTVRGAMPRATCAAFDTLKYGSGIEGQPSFILQLENPEPIPDYETKIAKQISDLIKTIREGIN